MMYTIGIFQRSNGVNKDRVNFMSTYRFFNWFGDGIKPIMLIPKAGPNGYLQTCINRFDISTEDEFIKS